MAVKTRYVRNGDVAIAYQVSGDGPIDLVIVPGFISHLELDWTNALQAEVLRALGSFARVIRFDKRGTGLSDPVPGVPTLEDRMEDVRAVMDAAGSERAAILGISEGGPMAALFAATYPERVSALVLYGTYAAGWTDSETERNDSYPKVLEMLDDWGEGRITELFAPSLVDDAALRLLVATYERSAASPGMARALIEAADRIDVRTVLSSIQAPTLVLHRRGDLVINVASGREMAHAIPDARFVELEGEDHIVWVGDRQRLVHEIEEFLTGARHVHEADRVLATILFTDIVRSTERAAELGDARWRELLEGHEEIARREIGASRGRLVKTLGDGILACFDGPARAIRCAERLRDAIAELGLEIRAGVHTGECEAMGDDLGGLAVHIGSRVATVAGPGEVIVSSTVKDLVVGSGLEFTDAGEHELKGVPGRWRLFRVAGRDDGQPLAPATEHMTRADRAVGLMARRAPGALRVLGRSALKERAAD